MERKEIDKLRRWVSDLKRSNGISLNISIEKVRDFNYYDLSVVLREMADRVGKVKDLGQFAALLDQTLQEKLEIQERIAFDSDSRTKKENPNEDKTYISKKIIAMGDLFICIDPYSADNILPKTFSVYSKEGYKLRTIQGEFKGFKCLDNSNFLLTVDDTVVHYRSNGIDDFKLVYQFGFEFEDSPFESIDKTFKFPVDCDNRGLIVLKHSKKEWLYSFLKGKLISSGFTEIRPVACDDSSTRLLAFLSIYGEVDNRLIVILTGYFDGDGIINTMKRSDNGQTYHNQEKYEYYPDLLKEKIIKERRNAQRVLKETESPKQ